MSVCKTSKPPINFFLPAAAAGFLFFMTWPWLPSFFRAIPLGSEPSTVAFFNLYILERSFQAATHGWAYWDAPFFHPHHATLAWSEIQPLAALLYGTLRWARFPMAFAYNVVVLIYLAAAAWAGYFLARLTFSEKEPAVAAGVWMALGSLSMQQFGVLHLLSFGLPILCYAYVLKLSRQYSLLTASQAAFFYLLTWLSCAQYGLMLSLLLPVMLFASGCFRSWTRKQWSQSSAVACATTAALLPVIFPHYQRLLHSGLIREAGQVLGNLHLPDLFYPAKGHWLFSRRLGLDANPEIYSWGIGLTCLGLLLFGLRIHADDKPAAQVIRTHLWVTGASLLIAFGPALGIHIFGKFLSPYRGLQALIPGLEGIRSPARISVFAIACVSALAGFSASRYFHRVAPRRLPAAMIFWCGCLFLEMLVVPISLGNPTVRLPEYRQAVDWLKRHPDQGAVLELPLPSGNRPEDFKDETDAMLRSLDHGHPLVNGYSGYFPEPLEQLKLALNRDPGGRGTRYLQALHVRYLLARPRAAALTSVMNLKCLARFLNGLTLWAGPEPLAPRRVSLPRRIHLRKIPQPGQIVQIRIPPLPQAMFLDLYPGVLLQFVFDQTPAKPWEVWACGSVLLDRRDSAVYLKIQKKPNFLFQGQGVLVSAERTQRPDSTD